MPPPETPGHSQASLDQWLVGSLLLSPGSWCAQVFVCALQESVSPVPWKFCNQGLQSQIPWGFSVPLLDPQVGKSVTGPRSFATVRELLLHNCSPVCGLSGRRLYGGAKKSSSKSAYATCCTSQVCSSQSPCPCGRPLLTCAATGDTQILKGRSGSVSCGVSGPWYSQGFVCAL